MAQSSVRAPGLLTRLKNQVHWWLQGQGVPVWYDTRYRWPMASIEARTGIEPRRADLVVSYLLDAGLLREKNLRAPHRARYQDLARVHTEEFLESLSRPETLGNIFAVDVSDVLVDEVLTTIRLACGGTIAAARSSLRRKAPSLNLLGGFHHAGPRRGGGFCAVNDIAVAVQALRAEGFNKRVVVLDLDAHPPDGTAECFAGDPSVWIGSLSGADWGKLEGVDETLLPPSCDDGSYLEALGALLRRMPPAGLVFVIAGGDVLEGDRFGAFALSLDGARRRDLRVLQAIESWPSVWLPGGGYTRDAWKLLAGTAMLLSVRSLAPVPADYDSLRARFTAIARELSSGALEGDAPLTEQDLMSALGQGGARLSRLLDFYTAEGLEYAFFRYGLLEHLRRLGYGQFRIAIDRDGRGDRMRLFARADGEEHLLIECVLEKKRILDDDMLYIHWLTLRHPRGRFSPARPRLPGQEEPGLGLAREAGEMLGQTATRLGLKGLAFRPAWLHTAYAARSDLHFIDPERQGRFEALLRDLKDVPLLNATQALAEGRVRMNGEPYAWEADEMVYYLDKRELDPARVAAERQRVHFSIVPKPDSVSASSPGA